MRIVALSDIHGDISCIRQISDDVSGADVVLLVGDLTDLAFNGQHVGSRSIRFFIEKFHPMICFSGHIHEARGIDSIAGTKVVNPGPFREGGYAYVRISEKVEELEIRRFKS